MIPPMMAPLVLPPITRPTTAPTPVPAPTFATSPALVLRPSNFVVTPEMDAGSDFETPLMAMLVGFSVSVPVVSPLFSDSLMAVTWSVTCEPAGITTRPAASLTSFPTVAVIWSPTLFLFDRISASVAAEKLVPAARLLGAGAGAGAAGAAAAGAGTGAGAVGFGLGLGLDAGLGAAAGSGAGVAVATVAVSPPGWSLSAA